METIKEMIERMCPEGVEHVRLDSICTFQRGKTITAKDAEDGDIPVIAGGQTPSYFHNVANQFGENVTVAGSGAYAGFVSYWNIPIYVSDAFVVIPSKELLHKYLFYFLKCNQRRIFETQKGAGVPHVHGKDIAAFEIPLPPLPIQQEIVRILDSFTQLQSNLEAELAARQKQYEYYRNKLLTFDKDDKSVEWKTLGETADIGTGSSNTNEGLEEGLYPFYTRGQEILKKNTYEYDETAVITAGDGVGVGKVIHFVEGKYALHQRAYRLCPNEDILLAKYLYNYMKESFYNYIVGNSVFASVSSIRKPKLMAYLIPIPPLDRQREIVSILDTFESLITNLKQEIEARKKQYEYYREQLLTF